MKEKEAKLLADWLEGKSDSTAVSADVVEAVYIIRPDLAPAPTIDVADILSQVTCGPFGEKEQAEEFPEEDLQNIFRPDLAAAPRVELDDIFASLTEGPLAEQSQKDLLPDPLPENVISFPSPSANLREVEDELPQMASVGSRMQEFRPVQVSAPSPQAVVKPQRSKVYAFTTIGSLLAAACALIIFLPTGGPLPLSEPTTDMLAEPVSQTKDFAENEASAAIEKNQVLQLDLATRSEYTVNEELAAAPTPVAEPIGAVVDNEEFEVSSGKASPTMGSGGRVSMGRSGKKKTSPRSPSKNTNALNALRQLAWDFKLDKSQIDPALRQELSTKQTVEELTTYLSHHNTNVMLEAAYRIGKKNTNSGISALEGVLRVKSGNSTYRRRAYALLGDLYRKKKNLEKAKQAYKAAIKL